MSVSAFFLAFFQLQTNIETSVSSRLGLCISLYNKKGLFAVKRLLSGFHETSPKSTQHEGQRKLTASLGEVKLLCRQTVNHALSNHEEISEAEPQVHTQTCLTHAHTSLSAPRSAHSTNHWHAQMFH